MPALRNGFMLYDPDDRATWPPGSGYDVLVCYRGPGDRMAWTVTWSEYGPGADSPWTLEVGTDWADDFVVKSPWVAWRLLAADYDSPDADAAAVLDRYYEDR